MRNRGNNRSVLDMNIHRIYAFDEFGYYKYTNAQPILPIHIHKDMVEICYLTKGKQTWVIQEENFEMLGGDLFVTFDEYHGTGESITEKGMLYWMILKRPQANYDFLGLKTEEAEELFAYLQSLPKLFKGSPKCGSLLQEIVQAYFTKPTLLNHITLENLLVAFLLEVIQCSRHDNNYTYHPAIAKILQYIEENLSEAYNLEDLADKCHLSLSRFKHLFKEETGIPPTEYINRKRIEKAEFLLANSHLSIKDIAYDLGFSSPAYFATVFKQYKGYSPIRHKELGGELKEELSK